MIRGFLQRLARTVATAQPGIVEVPVELEAEDGPDPDGTAPAPALAVYPGTVDVLRGYATSSHLPPTQAARHACPCCEGLEKTIALLRQERAELRSRLAAYQLHATRSQQLGKPVPLP